MNSNLLRSKLAKSLIIIAVFLLYRNSKYLFVLFIGKENWNNLAIEQKMTPMLLCGIVLALLLNYLFHKKISFKEFGLNTDFWNGLKWGFIFSLPMFIGYAFLVDFNLHFSFITAYKAMFLAGFGEEFIYRGLLFGFLFYYAGWGFLSAGLFTGIFFAWGHLYQADSFSSALGIFAFTAGASLGFAWFYYAWKSLWMVIFLHGFMDLAWDISMTNELADNVLGSPWVNVFRFSTLIFCIIYSVYHSKKIGTYDLKTNLWTNLK